MKVMLTAIWGKKEYVAQQSLEKEATINNASYYQIRKQNSLYLLTDTRVNIW